MTSLRSYTATLLLLPLLLIACNKPATEESDDSMMEADASAQMSMSLEDLVKLGKNYTCTFTDVDEAGNSTEGTVYVAGGDEKFRGNFSITQANGEQYDASVIHVENTNYVWTSQVEQGFMMTVDDDDSMFGSDDAANGLGVSDDESVNFDCKKWKVDNDMFTPPSDVEFVDIEAQMQQMMEEMGAMNNIDVSSQCASCEAIADETAKAQCLLALNC